MIRDLKALSGTLQEVHGEYCDCKVPVNLLATTLAQVYVGFKVEIITNPQTLIVKLLREKTAKCFHAAAQQVTGLLFQEMLLCQQQAYHMQSCPGFGCDRVNFLLSSWYNVVFWI